MLKDTIVAISTALQDGAISIIRLSGDDAISIVNRLFNRDLTQVKSHTIHYGFIHDSITEKVVDEVLISVFRNPRSFTCEDVVEIHCHGGIYITRRILSLCLACGARMAKPGEFTQRAFLNGRIDLTQAESIMDILEADNEKAASLAAAGIQGNIHRLLQPLIDDLLNLIAHIEVNIDYPEYDDVQQLTNEIILPQLEQFNQRLKELIHQAESGRKIKKGVKTVILGKPNVGKSSLLNALLEEDKAIVTEVAGTTRDLIEGVIHLKQITLHLIDTAGIHNTSDRIEQMGIDKTMQAVQEAELILVVFDGSQPMTQEDHQLITLTENKNRILITNKEDLPLKSKEGIVISARQGKIQPLIDEINHRYQQHVSIVENGVLNNDRQIALAMRAFDSLQQALSAIHQQMELDLVAIDLQSCYQSLKEILGETTREDLLDTLFSRFCLGK